MLENRYFVVFSPMEKGTDQIVKNSTINLFFLVLKLHGNDIFLTGAGFEASVGNSYLVK